MDILIPLTSGATLVAAIISGGPIMSGASLLAFAFVVAFAALTSGTARAANWLEMNFYMSGPEYEGKLPPCDYRRAPPTVRD